MKKQKKTLHCVGERIQRTIRDEITVPEYVLWWILRANMFVCIILAIHMRPDKVFEMVVSLVFMFVVTILHLAFPWCWLGRISFRLQTVAIIFLTLTSYCGAFLNFYYSMPWWDIVIHTMGGTVCVIVGYELLDTLKEKDAGELSPIVGAFSGFGFAFFCEVLWEVCEFFHDSLTGGDSQHWMPNPVSDNFEIFTVVPERYALLDTMTDMMCCLVGAVIGYIILWVVLHRRRKKRAAMQAQAERQEIQPQEAKE